MYLRFINFIILPFLFCAHIVNAADFETNNIGKILFKLEGFGLIKEMKNEVSDIETHTHNMQDSSQITFQYQGPKKKVIYNIKGGSASLTTFVAKYIAFDVSSGVSVYDVNTADISKNIIQNGTITEVLPSIEAASPSNTTFDKYLFVPISGTIQIHLPIKWFDPYVGVGYSGIFKLMNLNSGNPDLIRTAFGIVGVVGVNIDLPKNIIVSASLKYNSYDHGIDFFSLTTNNKYMKSASTRNIIESLSFYGGLGIKL